MTRLTRIAITIAIFLGVLFSQEKMTFSQWGIGSINPSPISFQAPTSSLGLSPLLANPLLTNPLLANSLLANSLFADPLLANSLLADPLLTNPLLANSLLANSLLTNSLLANPLLANSLSTNPLLSNPLAEPFGYTGLPLSGLAGYGQTWPISTTLLSNPAGLTNLPAQSLYPSLYRNLYQSTYQSSYPGTYQNPYPGTYQNPYQGTYQSPYSNGVLRGHLSYRPINLWFPSRIPHILRVWFRHILCIATLPCHRIAIPIPLYLLAIQAITLIPAIWLLRVCLSPILLLRVCLSPVTLSPAIHLRAHLFPVILILLFLTQQRFILAFTILVLVLALAPAFIIPLRIPTSSSQIKGVI